MDTEQPTIHLGNNQRLGMTRELLDEVTTLINSAENLGIRVDPSSRFPTYKRELEQLLPIDPRDKSTQLRKINLVLRTTTEVLQAANILSVLGHLETWRPLLQLLFSGSVHPVNDVRSAARDRQFELYVATAAQSLGMCPRPFEPDILVDIPSGTLHIAAKRVSSMNAMRKRLREGANQIKRCGNCGLIVVDVSRIIADHSKIFFSSTTEDAMQRARYATNTLMQSQQRWAKQLLSKGVLGITFWAFVPIGSHLPIASPAGVMNTLVFGSVSQRSTLVVTEEEELTRMVHDWALMLARFPW